MSVDEGSREGRPKRKKSIGKAQRWKQRTTCVAQYAVQGSAMLCISIAQEKGEEGGQGGNMGSLGLIMEGLDCQVKECGFY